MTKAFRGKGETATALCHYKSSLQATYIDYFDKGNSDMQAKYPELGDLFKLLEETKRNDRFDGKGFLE